MEEEFIEDGIDTEELEELVEEILRTIRAPYPTDIIDRVFLAIEHNPKRLYRYQLFAGKDPAVANQWIGRYVKEHTGLKVRGQCSDPKSKLIKSYSVLGH